MFTVGFDIRPALFDYAGIGRYVRELGTALTKIPDPDGPFLEMFAPSWRGGRQVPPGLDPSRHNMNRGFLPGRVMEQLNKLPGFDAARFPAKVDIFHWTDYIYPHVRDCAKVMTLHDAAFVADPTFHGWDTSVLLDRVRRALDSSDRIIVVSEPSRFDAELLGANADKVTVVPHGVSPYFKPADRELSESDYLLTVGTLEPRKNHMRTLRAMEKLWDQDAAPDWVIIGRPGWDYDNFLGAIAASRHRKRIRRVQNIADTELLRYYQNAMALVFPSLHEGFGLVVLEAMACGTPAVVGDQTAPAWVAGHSGLRVDPKDVDAIADGIGRMVSENAWRRQAAAVGIKRAREFTWENAAAQTVEVYQAAIRTHRNRQED
ncbi:MAG: glycosyltransferase family 1 protein [Planctomycetota bacterium]|jgi:alpha-1,3-rhamnosyl/mannosyltransferase|nr:glycosyltransferase family 1 protein [Planctomycetota bacterium]